MEVQFIQSTFNLVASPHRLLDVGALSLRKSDLAYIRFGTSWLFRSSVLLHSITSDVSHKSSPGSKMSTALWPFPARVLLIPVSGLVDFNGGFSRLSRDIFIFRGTHTYTGGQDFVGVRIGVI